MDAGPLYAYVDADDQHHQGCADLLETHPGPLIVPTLVITEVVYLRSTRLGTDPELKFLADLASGAFDIEPVHPTDWLRGVSELSLPTLRRWWNGEGRAVIPMRPGC